MMCEDTHFFARLLYLGCCFYSAFYYLFVNRNGLAMIFKKGEFLNCCRIFFNKWDNIILF